MRVWNAEALGSPEYIVSPGCAKKSLIRVDISQDLEKTNSWSLSYSGLVERTSSLPALCFQQGEKFVHVFLASSEIHRVYAEPRFAFQFCRRDPEAASSLDALGHVR